MLRKSPKAQQNSELSDFVSDLMGAAANSESESTLRATAQGQLPEYLILKDVHKTIICAITFHNFFKIIHKEFFQGWPFRSFQGVQQLLNFCGDSAAHRNTWRERPEH